LSGSKRREVGIFYLKPPDGKYATYGICWVEQVGQHRQTRRLSTGERTDEQEAWRKLQIHALENSEKQTAKPADQPIAQVLAWHWLNYGRNLASAPSVEGAKVDALKCWGTAMVSELDVKKQLQLIKLLRDRGMAEKTIKRRLSVIWTAMNTAASCQQLDDKVIPKLIEYRLWGERTQPVIRRSAQASKRSLELHEWAKLFDVVVSPKRHAMREPFLRYLILQMSTGGRTSKVVRLTRAQVDFEHGIIDLNSPGRTQNNKYNPKIPACDVLLRHLKAWKDEAEHGGRYVYSRGKRPLTLEFIRYMIKLSGVPNCTPYTLRHSVASWLADCEASHGVGRRERKMFIGHLRPDGGSTDDYTHYNPKYLRNAARAIDALFEAVAPLTKVDLLLHQYEDQPLPEAAWLGSDGLVEAMQGSETRIISPSTEASRPDANRNAGA
jgi:integrase